MKIFPSLPDAPHLRDLYRRFPEHVRPLLEYHDMLLRAESPLSVAQRELIAAYVSGLNACTFCFGAHKIMAQAFGVDPELIDSLLNDFDNAQIDEEMRPLLRYVAKLNATETMTRMTSADAKAVYDAGWSERALFDAIEICALYNYMNRIIEGAGVAFDYAAAPPSETEIAERRSRGYMDWGREIGIID